MTSPKSKQRLCASYACRANANRIDPSERKRVELTCKQCGISFFVAPSRVTNTTINSPKQYCSRKCRYNGLRGKKPLEETNKILYTCQECGKQWHDKPSLQHRKKFCSQVCVGMSIVRKLASQSPTSIELAVYQALTDLSMAFVPQYRIGRWLVDAYIPALNTVVECQGDFYHCNPVVYPNGPTHGLQRKNIDRDTRRFAELHSAGYVVIELWEKDINEVGAKRLLLDKLGETSGAS